MNNLLSNRYINTPLAYLSVAGIFILSISIAVSIGMFILSFLAVFFAGGVAFKTFEWFNSKLVVKNVSKIEEE